MSIVYILVNEAMPGYVKVGITDNVEQRMRSLDTTATPLPFECFYAAMVQDASFVEQQIFEAFADSRVRKNREFFRIAPERIAAVVQLRELEDATPRSDVVESDDDQRALDEARERRSAFNFEMVGIAPGAVLTFVDDVSVHATVIDKRKVEFDGETMSLSAAALLIKQRQDYNWRKIQGPAYWTYDGESLDERRRRMETAD